MALSASSLTSQWEAGDGDGVPWPPPAPQAYRGTTAGDVAETGLSVVYEPEHSEPILE